MNTNCHDTSKTKDGTFEQLFENHRRNPIPPKGPTTALVTGADFFCKHHYLILIFFF